MGDPNNYTLNDCDTSNDACSVDANTTTPSASGALPSLDTFLTNSPMPDASWWNELPFIENAISDLSETIQKVHTDSSNLASTNQDVVSGKQIYNMEDHNCYTLNDCDTSNDACTVDANTTTPSASGALPSSDTFLTNSPMPGASWWNELPFIENAISDLSETIQKVHTDSSNLASTNQDVVSGKQIYNMEDLNYYTLNDYDTSNDACSVDANTTTPSASGALPSFDTFLTNSPMPGASWWNELPFIENAISDLSETIQKVYTDSSNLASTNQDVVSGKQIYNMEDHNNYTLNDYDTSNDACTVDANTTTPSASGALPSSDTFLTNSPMPGASWWNELPFIENAISDLSETIQKVHTDSSNLASTNQDVVSGKQDEADWSFHMESILGHEQDDYNPRHSTPTKDESRPAYLQISETAPLNFMNGVTQLTGHCSTDWTPKAGYALQSSQSDIGSANNGCMVPSAKKFCRRQSNKPPYSFVAMIIVAIETSVDKELTLAEIREKLQGMFPFFRGEYTGWKNSVRHALSYTKCFYKMKSSDTYVSVWKVHHAFVNHNMFIRNAKETEYDTYKPTLQEELGLPPYDCKVQSESRGKVQSESRGKVQSESRGKVQSESRGKVHSESRGKVQSESRGKSRGKVQSESRGKSRVKVQSESRGKVQSESRGKVQSESRGESRVKVQSESRGKVQSESRGKVQSESRSKSRGKVQSESRGKVQSESRGKVQSESRGKSRGKVQSESRGKVQSESRGKVQSESRGKVQSESRGKDDLYLPPKPCYSLESGSLVGSNEEFLNGRNDIVPTPLSTVSDIDYVQEVKPSRKRKQRKKSYPTHTQSYAKQSVYMPSTVAMGSVHDEQYLQSSESGRVYDSMFSPYYPAGFTNGQQVSNDFYCYRNPQPNLLHHWNYWDNVNEISLQRWWFHQSMYHRISTNRFPLTYQTNTANWFPGVSGMEEAPLNLTKGEGHSQ